MPEIEPRYPCPVCLGVQMTKLRPARNTALVVDYCQRCGGMWFDQGEVGALRQIKPRAFARTVTLRHEAHRMACHDCHARMDRNAERCPACNWRNEIGCPVCDAPMSRLEHQGLHLDACGHCKGVWFDNVELAEIWNLEVTKLPARRPGTAVSGDVADLFLLETLLWAPDVVFLTAHGVAGLAGHAPDVAGAAGGVAEAAGGAVEATGELAAGVFGVIADIIGGIF